MKSHHKSWALSIKHNKIDIITRLCFYQMETMNSFFTEVQIEDSSVPTFIFSTKDLPICQFHCRFALFFNIFNWSI